MKARRSMVSHRNSFKFSSPTVSCKRFSSVANTANQENIAPRMDDSAAKRRKLYNGQAAVIVGESKHQAVKMLTQGHPVDMDISSVDSPKRGLDSRTSCIFTPPNNKHPTTGPFSGSFSTPRASTMRPKTIQEVFRNVTVYVEVKTIDEDRSDVIKAVAKQMGATVNDKLYKNTTHVIFREGSMTTYKKALKMRVPLVAVTWLEECRKTLSLVDPAQFLPINLEPYEHPELYKRVRKAAPSNGEVTTTPERFALKPTRPEDELEKALLEFQQTKMRLEVDSPTTASSTTQLGRTVLNFSPIGESTKIGARTPNGPSNMTPLLRRLMIRNAEEDRRERGNILVGRLGPGNDGQAVSVLDNTKYDRMSMDLSSMWGKDCPSVVDQTNDSAMSMEETVDLTSCSPDPPPPSKPYEPEPVAESKTSFIIRALRRQTMHFTQNASLDISPQAVKENVAVVVDASEATAAALDVSSQSTGNDSMDGGEGGLNDSAVKVPKICAVPRKSLEEDTLREDIVRAREELLGKAVVINKSDKRRSLLPMSMSNAAEENPAAALAPSGSAAMNKVNRRRTLFNVHAICEGGLGTQDQKKTVATKRRTLLNPASQSSLNSIVGSPSPVEKKRTKKALENQHHTEGGGKVVAAAPVTKARQSLSSLTQRRGTNMGPPTKIPPTKPLNRSDSKVVTPTAKKVNTAKPTAAAVAEEGATKRKLFNSIAELSPVSSPVKASPNTIRLKVLSKPFSPHTVQHIKERTVQGEATAADKQPVKKVRRSSLDFQQPSSGNSNSNSVSDSSAATSARGTMCYGGGAVKGQRNVIVLTNGHGKHLEYIKEIVDRLGGNFEVDTRVTSKTTHLVCYEKKRNMNMLRSVIRGIWVLDYDWVVKSADQGRWQREEEYQLNTFGGTLTRVRSERQAFGPNYKMELFSGTGKYYVYEMSSVPGHFLKELIMLCGGIVVDTASDAKYLIADKARAEVQVISPSWVFECVCQYAFLNHKKYLKK